jgi:NTE family protein
MIPEGRVSLEPQAEGFRRMFPEGWPARDLWICAVRLHDGHRVVFGREGKPATDVGSAVIASGAVPPVCKPVRIGDHRYVDGGFRSMTSLDLLAGRDLDLVLVSSPMTCERGPGPTGLARRVRSSLRRRLEREARRVRSTGAPVVIFQPTPMQAAAIGMNFMDTERMAPVAAETRKITRERLQDPILHETLAPLIS